MNVRVDQWHTNWHCLLHASCILDYRYEAARSIQHCDKSPPLQVEDIRMTMLESEAMLANLAKLLGHGGGHMLPRNHPSPRARMYARTDLHRTVQPLIGVVP